MLFILFSFYGVSVDPLTVRSRITREPTLCNRAAFFLSSVSDPGRARAAAFQDPGSKGPGLAGLAVAIDPGQEIEARSQEPGIVSGGEVVRIGA